MSGYDRVIENAQPPLIDGPHVRTPQRRSLIEALALCLPRGFALYVSPALDAIDFACLVDDRCGWMKRRGGLEMRMFACQLAALEDCSAHEHEHRWPLAAACGRFMGAEAPGL